MPGLLPILLTTSHLLMVADKVPVLDMEPTCRAATMASALASRDENACKRDEEQARTKLEQDWTQYTDVQRDRCGRLTSFGGPPSYVELLTCLEMSKAAANLPRDALSAPLNR
jgi:hypothetical protein